jgi:Cyclin, N-terminal domain
MNLDKDQNCSQITKNINLVTTTSLKNQSGSKLQQSGKDLQDLVQGVVKKKYSSELSTISTKEGSLAKSDGTSITLAQPTKPADTLKRTLSKLKKAIILEITQSYLSFTHGLTNFSIEQEIESYNFFKTKLKRLYVQNFLTEGVLLYSVELFRLVLEKSEQAEVTFSSKHDSLFKVFVVCFFIANKFNDELHFISAEDLAYIAHSKLKTVKALELAILCDVLNWKLVSL